MTNDGASETVAAVAKFNAAAKRLEKTIAELAEGPANRADLAASTMRALDRLVRMTDAGKLGGDVAASDACYARWQSLAAARNAACERGTRLAASRVSARADALTARPVAAGADIALSQWRRELAVSRCG